MTSEPNAPRFRRYSSETRVAMLIEASFACLARGGITAFTVDNICREAHVSRGLITHHFGSKDALLAAVYESVYDQFVGALFPEGQPEPGLVDLVESFFAPSIFNAASLRVWLALWGEIANNPALGAVHRRRYRDLLAQVARAIAAEARLRGKAVDAEGAAVVLVGLSDGLWLEHGIDTTMLSHQAACAACFAYLESLLGPLDRKRGTGPAPAGRR